MRRPILSAFGNYNMDDWWRGAPKTVCFQLDPVTLGLIMGGSAGIGALGNVGSALIGSSASSSASQQAAAAENAALMAQIGGEESATAALQPYTQGGLQNYDFLNYLLTGVRPTAATWTDANQQQMDALQSYINNYGSTRGGQSGKYGASLADAQAQLAQLQQQQQASQAATGAQNAITSSGLPANWLTNIPQFSYNVATDPNLANASTWASGQIAAGNTAAGNYGSGNMASAIGTELAGTLEPEYYNQAYQNYLANQVNPRQTVYSELTGNVGGAGQNAATTLGGIYTGSAQNAGQYLSGIGTAQASGTLGSANALSTGVQGISNLGTNMGSNYLNYSLLSNLFQNAGGGSGVINAGSNAWNPVNYSFMQ